ncbi:MAG: hypothetical protein ACI389_06155 [Methanobrevibacter sp.]|uniref:hypothetical protein n=1 Tax=Methanobrevibacter sp. TaxID=66852 RepID=UPI003EFE0614
MVAPLMKLNQEEYYKWKQSVLSSKFYEDVIKKRKVTDTTKNRYVLSLATYCMYNNMSVDELMKEADDEERANIRVKDRKILKRLDNYRDWLVEQGLQKMTCQTRFNDAKWCYRRMYIEVPELNEFDYPREQQLKYSDLPTTIDIQKAVDGANALSNKALYLFVASSGTAKMETSLLTVQDFIDATRGEYHNEIDNIHNVLKILDGKKDVIPLFEMHREKTDYYYHTCCSPEATQAIINLLQAQPIIKNDDPLFYLSYNGIAKAFQRANHKHNWGKIKNYYYFSSHRLRKRHASIIGNYDLANYLQGRKPDNKIKETYYFNNPKKVKEEYLKHLNELTIYESNYKDIYSEEYEELLKENEELRKLIDSQKTKITELDGINKALSKRMGSVETQVKDMARSNDITYIQSIALEDESVNKYGLMDIIIDLYTDDVEGHKIKHVDAMYVKKLIPRALIIRSYDDDFMDENGEWMFRDNLLLLYGQEKFDEVWRTIDKFRFIAFPFMEKEYLHESQSRDIDIALLRYMKKLYDDGEEPTQEAVYKIVWDVLDIDEVLGDYAI